ncbi:hypothetical protein ACLX1H_000521 [Fusarium chlamydosporum]
MNPTRGNGTSSRPQSTSSPLRNVTAWAEDVAAHERAASEKSARAAPLSPATVTAAIDAELAGYGLYLPDSPEGNNENENDASSSLSSDDELSITAITEHEVNFATSTVKLNLKWSDGDRSWEEERHANLGGRDRATGLDEYHIFAILRETGSRKKKTKKLLCQWVGYPDADGPNSWEPEAKVQKIAEGVYNEWVDEKKKHTKKSKV